MFKNHFPPGLTLASVTNTCLTVIRRGCPFAFVSHVSVATVVLLYEGWEVAARPYVVLFRGTLDSKSILTLINQKNHLLVFFIGSTFQALRPFRRMRELTPLKKSNWVFEIHLLDGWLLPPSLPIFWGASSIKKLASWIELTPSTWKNLARWSWLPSYPHGIWQGSPRFSRGVKKEHLA